MNKLPLKSLLTEIRNGVDLDQHDFPLNSNMLPISRIETIWDGTIDFSRIKYANVTDKDRQRYRLQKGDILFSHINSPEHIGKTAIFESHRSLIHGINLLLLRVNPDQCFPKYLSYYLKTNDVRANFRVRCKKAVNQASLNQDDVTSLEAPLPSLPEQKRIAAILDKSDRLRRQRRYAQTLSDSFLQSVFIKMFGDPVSNPQEWQVSSVEELCTIVVDCPHSTPKYADNRTPFACIRTSDIQDGFIDWSSTKYVDQDEYEFRITRYKPAAGDVLYSREGERFGLAAQVPNNTSLCLGQRMMLLKANGRLATNEFLCSLMNSKQIYSQAERLVGGSTSPHVNVGDIKNFEAICPPLSLQEKFAAIVQKFERIRRQQREATRQAEHLFQTLLHRAFRGEL